jgi:glycosyltransferase involved in cell wall biosynthesis
MERLRIAHVVANFPPRWAGAGSVALQYAVGVARRGHEVTVLTPREGAEPLDDPPEIAVQRLPVRRLFGSASFTPGLIALIRHFDVVHLHWPFVLGAELCWVATRMSGVPYVLSYHMDLRSDLRWAFGPYQRFLGPIIVRSAARVLPVSLDHFRASPTYQYVAQEPGRIVEIPNGVDVSRFHPNVDGTSVRARFGIPPNAVVVGYLGSMDQAHAFKGVPLLIEALRRVTEPEVHLLGVGGGELQPEYRRHALELGIGERAHWTGIVPAGDLPASIAAMDMLVLPSLASGAESFGIVLLEAMASGKPVVATSLPGVRRVVDDSLDGYVVPPGDVDRLVSAIERLARNAGLRRLFGSAGRRKVIERYDWRKIAGRLTDQYFRVLGADGSSS